MFLSTISSFLDFRYFTTLLREVSYLSVIREKKHVTAILKSRVNSLTGDREFLAQWSGDDSSTWEPEIALSNCDALKKFLEKEEKTRNQAIAISNERKFKKKVKIVSIKKEAQLRYQFCNQMKKFHL